MTTATKTCWHRKHDKDGATEWTMGGDFCDACTTANTPSTPRATGGYRGSANSKPVLSKKRQAISAMYQSAAPKCGDCGSRMKRTTSVRSGWWCNECMGGRY